MPYMAGSTLDCEPMSHERRRTSGFVTRLVTNPSGAIGAILLAVLLVGFIASWFTPFDPTAQDLLVTVKPPSLTATKGRVHLLGTDQLGRDLLSRLLVGLRISLVVAFVAVPISISVGVLGGLASGYFGGRTDMILMRVVDAQLAIPTLLLLIAVVAVLGSGLTQIILVLAFAGWTTYARVMRVEALSLRERDFVVAARAAGANDTRILGRHVLPNVIPAVVVLATLQLPSVIIWEAGLSFLG